MRDRYLLIKVNNWRHSLLKKIEIKNFMLKSKKEVGT